MADADTPRCTSAPDERPAFAVPPTDPALAILDRLDAMIWIIDIDMMRFVWGNRASIDYWSSHDLESFCRRPITMSEKFRALHMEIRERLREERAVRFETTVYPEGRPPDRMAVRVSPYPLLDGRIALFIEASSVRVTDPETLRRMDAVRYAPLVLTIHAVDGLTLSANAIARSVFAEGFDFVSLFRDAEVGRAQLDRLGRGEDVSEDVELRTLQGDRWYAVEARNMTDPVTSLPAILLSAHEITARRELERAKDELISVVSHELRTPLTAIRGSLELLASSLFAEDPAVRHEMLGIARENVARLNRTVDDLLDVRRLTAGAVELSMARVDLGELVQRTVELQRPAAHVLGVSIRVAREEPVVCCLDAHRIQQVLDNLLSNALKHSSAGQVVGVEVVRAGARARVTVTDQGPGVPAGFRDRMFTVFAQADASDRRQTGGTGLGLYISKTLVEEHGGELGYDPDVTPGARFFFDLPIAS